MVRNLGSLDTEPKELHNGSIEKAIQRLEEDNSQTNVYALMDLLKEKSLEGSLLFIPVIDAEEKEDPSADLFRMDKVSLEDMLAPSGRKQAIPRKVELFKGGFAYTAFTSRAELDKGESTKFTSMPMKEFFQMVLEDEDSVGLVLNPWDVSILLDKKLLAMVLGQKAPEEAQGRVFIEKGDITDLEVDAIVNAANTSLMPGGGVCGAIFKKAGPQLVEECMKIGGCPTGQARLTNGYNLPAKYVIHTPGPVYTGIEEDEKLLASCYHSALDLAQSCDLHTIAFPAISTGIYGFPLDKAVPIAVVTVSKWLADHPDYPMEVALICYDEPTYQAYKDYVQDSVPSEQK